MIFLMASGLSELFNPSANRHRDSVDLASTPSSPPIPISPNGSFNSPTVEQSSGSLRAFNPNKDSIGLLDITAAYKHLLELLVHHCKGIHFSEEKESFVVHALYENLMGLCLDSAENRQAQRILSLLFEKAQPLGFHQNQVDRLQKELESTNKKRQDLDRKAEALQALLAQHQQKLDTLVIEHTTPSSSLSSQKSQGADDAMFALDE